MVKFILMVFKDDKEQEIGSGFIYNAHLLILLIKLTTIGYFKDLDKVKRVYQI